MDRTNKNRIFCLLPSIAAGLLLLTPNITKAYDKETYAEQRTQFVKAERALKKGQISRYRRLAAQLEDYPLYPYLKQQELKRRLSKVSADEIRDFIETFKNSPPAERLHQYWLHKLARQGKWQDFVDNYRPAKSTSLRCSYARALFAVGDEHAIYVTKELWLTGKSLPKTCDKPIQSLRKAGVLDNDLVWQRIRLAMHNGRSRLAKYLAKELPKAERSLVKLWSRARRQPKLVEKVHDMAVKERPDVKRWILIDGLRSMARKDEIKASKLWLKLQDDYPFQPQEQQRIERRLVYKLMQNPASHAQALLRRLNPTAMDNNLKTYYTFSALKDKDWKSALDWMGQLETEEQLTPRWGYWRARALEALGHLEEARGIYMSTADERSYYSFLASDRAGMNYQFDNRPIVYTDEELLSVKQFPPLVRAAELFFLKRIVQARREWRVATSLMDKTQLLKAAKLANQWGWYDRTITTLAHAKYWDDLELRFPLAHQKVIMQQAERQKINPAWAFAIIRQESAFTPDARSHAGAMGLMQIMPRTARQVARSMRLRTPRRNDLLNINTNVRLGVRYLKKVQDKFNGHAVLATAAYNAGGYRVKQWIPEQGEIPADLWVELVPFSETRDYLQRVLAYMVIYEKRLEIESVTLLKRMLPILGKQPIAVLSQKPAKKDTDV